MWSHRPNRSARGFLARLLRTVMLAMVIVVPGRAAELDVVVHAALDLETLKLSTLRAVFGMRILAWPDGTPIKVFVLAPDSELHSQFTKNKLQVFPYQLQQAWDRLVFSGTGQAPFSAASIEDMERRIAETPGSIGYLPAGHLSRGVSKVEVTDE